MRKIHHELENPFDSVFIYMSELTSGFYHDLDMEPNVITTISLLFGLLAGYFLYKKQNTLATVCWFIAYYYDCTDGFMARKYNQVTTFGDIYDHVSDTSKVIVILAIMYYLDKDKFFYWSPVFVFVFSLMLVHLSCQEKIYNKPDESVTINQFEYMCPNSELIKYTRYFGVGTTIMLLGYVIFTFEDKY